MTFTFMKRLLLLLLGATLGLHVTAQNSLSALMPMPNEVAVKDNGTCFTIDGRKTTISMNSDLLNFAAGRLQDVLLRHMQEEVGISHEGKGRIRLLLDPSMEGNREHYTLDIGRKGIEIRGASAGAVFYGVMTLDQILRGDVCNTAGKKVGGIHIDDAPRYAHRAFMLDPARHFLPVESVKFFIDKMAQYKYNVLQLHLTDDQGWRVYIEKHPTLASKEHYTRGQLEDIIRYAAERNVTVVPEMDIPGHTSALLAAFPEMKCAHMDSVEVTVGKSENMMLCAAAERVYEVLDDVIKEISAIFPAEYIHLGGDEAAVARNWAKCPRCAEMMQRLGYTKPSQLMTPFFDKVMQSVRRYGKRTILWCELDNICMPVTDYLFPYPEETTLVTWRAGLTPKCMEYTHRHGHPLIMAPGEYAYLDYPQYKGDLPEFNNWGMPTTTLETCYRFDPGYGLPEGRQAHVMGIMATLWGEAICDINRATYMAFPRGLALAEAGWTNMENRSWESFKERLQPNILSLMQQGVSVRIPFEINQNLGEYK